MVTKEHILDTAVRLFVRRGCKSVTMDEIAAECGISKRTLYEQFEDKSTLLSASIILMGEREGEKIKEIQQRSDNVLEFLIHISHYQSDARIKFYDDFFLDLKKYYPEVYHGVVANIRTTHFENNKKMIQAGQQQGLFLPYLNVDMLSTVVSETINIVKESRMEMSYDRKEFLQQTMFVYLRGMSTPKGIEIIDKFLNSFESNNK